MTTVPLTAPPGDDTANPAEAVLPEPAGPRRATPVGLVELSERVVESVLNRCPWLYRAVEIFLAACTVVCLIAIATRRSPLPLLPIPLFGVTYLLLRRLRTAETRAHRFRWSMLTALAAMTGFYLVSVVGRWVS
ncbi:hypothetical protein [Amycolatopsis panacis]|uniref:hypothetical protein n=1 Tax=Amycolatopsis panacis TaxID=2340917 RepID=UPI001F232517|nr:hypothetical protein [Amycolatopsis panacis]